MQSTGIQTVVKKAAQAPVGLVKLVFGVTALEASNRYAVLAASHPELPHRLTPRVARSVGWRWGIAGNNAANALATFSGLSYSGIVPLPQTINAPYIPFPIDTFGIAFSLYSIRILYEGLIRYDLRKMGKKLSEPAQKP